MKVLLNLERRWYLNFFIQPLSTGHLLLAGHRCRHWGLSGEETNSALACVVHRDRQTVVNQFLKILFKTFQTMIPRYNGGLHQFQDFPPKNPIFLAEKQKIFFYLLQSEPCFGHYKGIKFFYSIKIRIYPKSRYISSSCMNQITQTWTTIADEVLGLG